MLLKCEESDPIITNRSGFAPTYPSRWRLVIMELIIETIISTAKCCFIFCLVSLKRGVLYSDSTERLSHIDLLYRSLKHDARKGHKVIPANRFRKTDITMEKVDLTVKPGNGRKDRICTIMTLLVLRTIHRKPRVQGVGHS